MLTTREVVEKVREAIFCHGGSEQELYTALLDEAECWKMRLEELEQKDPDEEDDDE